MDPIILARLQFAMTIGFHFLFPPISIGLAWLLVFVEGMALRTGDPVWVRLGRFFAKLLGLTFVIGVATGLVMLFQFGTNWASYSRFVGDIFGAPLAAEAVFAFFLESTFLAIYLFGRDRVTPGIRLLAIWMVAIGTVISAFFILVANSWQQTPAGCAVTVAGTGELVSCADAIRDRLAIEGRVVLTSFSEAVFNPSMWIRFFHVMTAALVTGAFFMGGVSAYLLLKGGGRDVAARGLRLAIASGFVFAVISAFPTGHKHGQQVARDQPEKFAAIEGLYTTQQGAPLVLFALPHGKPPALKASIEIPNVVSWLAFGDFQAEVRGIDEFPADEIPPLWITFVSFHNMVLLGLLFQFTMFLGLLLWWKGRLDTSRWYHKMLFVVSPLPLAANQFGWVAAEVGRQPWTVYRLLRTSDSVSITVSAGEIIFSLVLIGLVYILLLGLYLFVLLREMNHGPEPLPAMINPGNREVA